MLKDTILFALDIAPIFAIPLAVWAMMRPREIPLIGKLL
jgi:hypothetical protein